MNVIRHKEPCGDVVYTVFHGEEKIATVCRGWLRLGGEQWVAMMADRAPFGERTLKDMMRRIEKLIGGAA